MFLPAGIVSHFYIAGVGYFGEKPYVVVDWVAGLTPFTKQPRCNAAGLACNYTLLGQRKSPTFPNTPLQLSWHCLAALIMPLLYIINPRLKWVVGVWRWKRWEGTWNGTRRWQDSFGYRPFPSSMIPSRSGSYNYAIGRWMIQSGRPPKCVLSLYTR